MTARGMHESLFKKDVHMSFCDLMICGIILGHGLLCCRGKAKHTGLGVRKQGLNPNFAVK